MHCFDRERSPRHINYKKQVANKHRAYKFTYVIMHPCRQTHTLALTKQNYVFLYVPIYVCNHIEKPLERYDSKWQQCLESMGLGGGDTFLNIYISVV